MSNSEKHIRFDQGHEYRVNTADSVKNMSAEINRLSKDIEILNQAIENTQKSMLGLISEYSKDSKERVWFKVVVWINTILILILIFFNVTK